MYCVRSNLGSDFAGLRNRILCSIHKLHFQTKSQRKLNDHRHHESPYQSDRYWDPQRNTFRSKLLNHVKIAKGIHPEIQRRIDSTKSGKEVVYVMKKHGPKIQNVAIYNKAMQRCSKLEDSDAVLDIMEMVLSSKIKPDLISFSTLINALATSSAPGLCVKYFEIMVNRYRLKPDVIVFGALLKSFKTQRDVESAECYFQSMSTKYGIDPNEHCYSEMMSIYARTGRIKNGVALFNRYLLQIENGSLRPSVNVFASYLALFSRSGEVKGMKHAVSVIRDFGFKVDKLMMAEIKRGCSMEIEKRNSISVSSQESSPSIEFNDNEAIDDEQNVNEESLGSENSELSTVDDLNKTFSDDQCRFCGKLYKRKAYLQKHELKCPQQSKEC